MHRKTHKHTLHQMHTFTCAFTHIYTRARTQKSGIDVSGWDKAAKAETVKNRWGVELSSEEHKTLVKALRRNIFGFANPKNAMVKMGLTPLHMPFGSNQRIIDYARAEGLGSVPHLEAWIQARAEAADNKDIKVVSLSGCVEAMTDLIDTFVDGLQTTVGLWSKSVRIEGHGDINLEIWHLEGADGLLIG